MIDVVLLCDDLSLLVLVGLPCAYLDEWLVGIAEINHQEKISLVTIAVGVPVLLECYFCNRGSSSFVKAKVPMKFTSRVFLMS